MDLNFYSDLTDGTGQPGDPEFLDAQAFNGFDTVQKFPGGSDNFLPISGEGHPFLSSSEVPLHSTYSLQIQDAETFHTPSLGDEEFEIPPISLDPDSALSVSDVVSHFGELGDGGPAPVVPGNAVVQGNDPSFASTFVNPTTQGLEHLSLMTQQGGGPMLGSTLGMDLGHPIGSQFRSSSPMTIDVPLPDINHGLLGHNPLTTIDQSELSAQLGLSLGAGAILTRTHSPDQPLSATGSPSESLQDDDMDDFRRSVLVESPISLSVSPGVISLSPALSEQPALSMSSMPPALVRKGVGVGGGAKKGKKKKDPNEPQKPVSAYALFFRDTQAAIKGQNPNATFGEVSKIVASMWDSLGEEQKQVYKRKTEAAKKEYLKALAAYRASQLSQTTIEVLDTAPSPPTLSVIAPAPEAPPPQPTPTRTGRIPVHAPDNNTITNICTSNIIIDLPQVTTRSRTGAHKPPASTTPPSAPTPTLPTVTKIIPKQPSARQPPPLQQMQNTPPPPRLQQMVHSVAPPPLQAKPRGGGAVGQATAPVAATPPPPLQIKIVPAPAQADVATPIIVTSTTEAPTDAATMEVEVAQPAAIVTTEAEEGMEVQLNSSPAHEVDHPAGPSICVRAGCNNPPVESKDWDREYCSNECVATHCRDVFMAWCAIRGQNSTTVI
ncbi:TOX high mobility group box family member 4b isoform X2 [Tachysurus fulvidraco]|uniref:TOX high mobility group box family member 4b isoform X2 n=1 Tax=Tachysurus fulvidraco TaxID=1234273 RepID=UPI001FEEAB22|nr:TOX high mobility group box family member 4b isoform X2 [Tachysurus fulvidraco]